MHICVHMWREEVSVGSLSSIALHCCFLFMFYFVLKQGLAESRAHQFSCTRWVASSRDLPVKAFPLLGLQINIVTALASAQVLGIKLGSPCLPRQQFTNRLLPTPVVRSLHRRMAFSGSRENKLLSLLWLTIISDWLLKLPVDWELGWELSLPRETARHSIVEGYAWYPVSLARTYAILTMSCPTTGVFQWQNPNTKVVQNWNDCLLQVWQLLMKFLVIIKAMREERSSHSTGLPRISVQTHDTCMLMCVHTLCL